MQEKLKNIKEEALRAIEAADVPEKLNDVRVRFLGKKGEKQMKIILKGLGWCIVLIVALSFIYFFWYRGKPKEGLEHFVSEEPTIVVQRVEAAPLVLTRSYIGTVIPIHSVDILPFISGFVEDVKVNSGQSVSAGDVMFVLQQH